MQFLSGVWKVINSNFAIWLLGSVAVGGIVAWDDRLDKARDRESLEVKLDIEIGSRINRLQSYMLRMESIKEASPLNVAGVLRQTGPVRDQPYPMGVFSEYAERTLESLLWELSITVKDKEQGAILEALHSSRRLRNIEADITVQTPNSDKQTIIDKVNAELNNHFGLSRWQLSDPTSR